MSKELFNKLEREGIIIDSIGEKGKQRHYTLIIPVMFGKNYPSKAEEIAKKHKVEYNYKSLPVGEGINRETIPVYEVECSEKEIEKSAEKLKNAYQEYRKLCL